jgi:hypothetical protein
VRKDGIIVNRAVLIAIGVDWRRQVLAVDIANREPIELDGFFGRTEGAASIMCRARSMTISC